MSPFKRSSLIVLLLVMIALITAGHVSEQVVREAGDVVQMSPGSYSHTLGTPADIVKLDYPKGSIVQDTVGDISLSVTLNSGASSVWIFLPPEFSFLQTDTRSVWTSITNNYRNLKISSGGSNDPVAPSWWAVRIENTTIPVGTYTVKMFNVKAPSVCGRYFMKILVDGASIGSENFPTIVVEASLNPAYISGRVLNGEEGQYGLPVKVPGRVIAQGTTSLGKSVSGQAYFDASANGTYTIYGLAAGTYSLNASAAGFAPTPMNETVTVYPGQSLSGVNILVYPSATISGTVLSESLSGPVPWGYTYNMTIGQTPRPISIELSDSSGTKQALAVAKTDPSLTFYHFSFNGSLELDGHIPQDEAAYVSGLQTGDYYINAFVNGYVQRDIIPIHVQDYTHGVSVSLDLWRSGWFQVTVFFRDSEGGHLTSVPAGGILTLNAYQLDGTLRGSNSTSVTAGSQTWTMEITGILSTFLTVGRFAAAPGRDYGFPSGTYMIEASYSGYVQTLVPEVTIGEGYSATSLGVDLVTAGGLEVILRSINWQTPTQEVPWQYPGATMRLELVNSMGAIYQGTAQQQTDASETIAHVTDLPADTYLVRAYTPGYIMTGDYAASVSLGSTSSITINLLKTTAIEITLEFRTAGLITPIDTYPYDLTQVPVRIEVYDEIGLLAGANATYIPLGESNSTIELVGFQDYAGNPSLKWANYYDTTDGSSQKDYGLPAGTYLIRAWVPGYLQAGTSTVTISRVASIVGITLSLDKLARVYGSVRGLNMYEDLIQLSWSNVTAYGPIMATASSLDGSYEMWLVSGTYTLAVSSPGYEGQATEIQVSMAWDTPVDFDLKPPGGAIAQPSAAGLTLPVVPTVLSLSLYPKKSLSDFSLNATRESNARESNLKSS
jgi:hypothetical protein